MLAQLLFEIRSGGTLEVGSLASRLNTSPQMIEAMLEHLQRAGYIQPYQACDSGCDGCGLQSDCHKPPAPRLWQG